MHELSIGAVAALEAYFADRVEVSFAFLFGSQARGTATAISDIDIAVYFRPANGERLDYQEETEYPAESEIRFRNVPAHEYIDVRWRSLRRFIGECEPLYRGLLEAAKRYLAEALEDTNPER